MRLKSSEDFQEMVSILSKRGMDFSQQRPSTARPDTSSTRPNTAQRDDRPLTSLGSDNPQQRHGVSQPRSSPFHVPVMEAGCLSQRPTVGALPRTGTSKAGQLGTPAREFVRDESLGPRNPLPSRPSSAHLWRSAPSQSIRPNIYDVQQSTNTHASETLARGSADLGAPLAAEGFFQFSAAGSEAGQGALQVTPQHGHSSGGVSSRNYALSSDAIEPRDVTALSVTSATTMEHEIPPERVLPFKVSSDLRPSSAISTASSAPFTMPDTLELEIPPHRELPFKRPAGRISDGTSRPGSAVSHSGSKKAESSTKRPKTASSAQKRQSEIKGFGSISSDASEPTKTMRFPVQSGLSFVASKSSPTESEDVAEKVISMQELIYGGSQVSSARARVNSTMDAPHEIESPPPHPAAIPQATRFSTAATTWSAGEVDVGSRFDPATSPENGSHALNLDQYTSQTAEARAKALDQFMIDNLKNPSFTTLCEDIEQCWRRIALGL